MILTHTTRHRWLPFVTGLILAALLPAAPVDGQQRGAGSQADTAGARAAPNLAELIAATAEESDLRVAVRRFELDWAVIGRRYDVPLSPVRIERERVLLNGWLQRLDELDAAGLNEAGQVDYEKLREAIQTGLADLEHREQRMAATEPLMPFRRAVQILQENRRDRLDVNPFDAAQTVEEARIEVVRLREVLANDGPVEFPSVTPGIAADALEQLDSLRQVLDNWYGYYYGFDPLFTWWVQAPYGELKEALAAYETAIRQAWPTGG